MIVILNKFIDYEFTIINRYNFYVIEFFLISFIAIHLTL